MTRSEGRVLVIASVNMDLVTHVTCFPSAGETRLGSNSCTYQGANGANRAVAAARVGRLVWFMGRVGSEAFGTHFTDRPSREDINVTDPKQVDGASGVAFIMVSKDSENTIKGLVP